MSGLVIKGCEYDPIESKDVVYGDGFRMELEQAIALASTGVEFWAAERDGSAAPVSVAKNEYGDLILRTDRAPPLSPRSADACTGPLRLRCRGLVTQRPLPFTCFLVFARLHTHSRRARLLRPHLSGAEGPHLQVKGGGYSASR